MPEMDGIEATRRLAEHGLAAARSWCSRPSTSTSTSTRRCAPARRLPAQGRAAPTGSSTRCARSPPATRCSRPSVTRRLVERFVRRAPPAQGERRRRFAELTARELEVLRLLARGLSNAEIAARARASARRPSRRTSARVLTKLGRARPRAGGRAGLRERPGRAGGRPNGTIPLSWRECRLCPPVHPLQPRFAQAITGVLCLEATVFDQPRGAGRGARCWCCCRWSGRAGRRSRGSSGASRRPRVELEPAAPVRFSQGLAAVFLAIALGLLLAGSGRRRAGRSPGWSPPWR